MTADNHVSTTDLDESPALLNKVVQSVEVNLRLADGRHRRDRRPPFVQEQEEALEEHPPVRLVSHLTDLTQRLVRLLKHMAALRHAPRLYWQMCHNMLPGYTGRCIMTCSPATPADVLRHAPRLHWQMYYDMLPGYTGRCVATCSLATPADVLRHAPRLHWQMYYDMLPGYTGRCVATCSLATPADVLRHAPRLHWQMYYDMLPG